MEEPLQKYEYVGILGVTDLKSHSPWAEGQGWPYWAPGFDDVTEESYNADPKTYEERAKAYNENYIAELKAASTYGTEYRVGIEMKHNPIYDRSDAFAGSALSSYRMVFLDNNQTEEYDRTTKQS